MPDAENFWPDDLFSYQEKPPLAIMKEQASRLTETSKYRLHAEIVTTVTDSNRIRRTFYLVVPALDNYRYELLEIEHGALTYPVKVISEPRPRPLVPIGSRPRPSDVQPRIIETEADFVSWLRNVLGSGETKKIIGALYAQAIA